MDSSSKSSHFSVLRYTTYALDESYTYSLQVRLQDMIQRHTWKPLSIAIFEMVDPMKPVPPSTRIFGARAKAASPKERAISPSSSRRIARQQQQQQRGSLRFFSVINPATKTRRNKKRGVSNQYNPQFLPDIEARSRTTFGGGWQEH